MMMDWTSPLVPLSVFIASLMGSTHCVGMCTPFVLASGEAGKKGLISYHLMRLFGYILLALPFHFLIQEFSNFSVWTHLISAVLMGSLILAVGVKILRGQSFHKQGQLVNTVFKRIFKIQNSTLKSGVIGLLTPLLPCGWLYAFLLVAVSQSTVLMSLIFIVIFWMGTLPALGLVSLIGQQSFFRFQGKKRLILGIFLIVFGSLTLYYRVAPLLKNPETRQQIFCL